MIVVYILAYICTGFLLSLGIAFLRGKYSWIREVSKKSEPLWETLIWPALLIWYPLIFAIFGFISLFILWEESDRKRNGLSLHARIENYGRSLRKESNDD